MEEVISMAKPAKNFSALIVLALTAYLPMVQPASALSAEIAKKCRAMAIEANPSPKLGSKVSGADKAQRDYFRECIAQGGNTEKSIGGAGGAATGQKSNTGTGMGGTATSGTGVRTGKGPLSQPIPPATSTTNPQQNPQQNPQRPQNTPGPAQTNPPQEPFGSR
jgi:hypothetical protein